MSTFALSNPESAAVADDFSALEQRIHRTIELLKAEREARATAEGNAATLQQLLDEQSATLSETQDRLRALDLERSEVRSRVERMMKQLDEIGS